MTDTTIDRARADATARAFFDDLWKRGDFWELESSAFEQAKYARAISLISDRRYSNVLEIGCGTGVFTRLLADHAARVLGVDASAIAIERARAMSSRPAVEFRIANIMEMDPVTEGPWDLVVISETIYYLGWLYSFFDVAWLARQLFVGTGGGGRLLMVNSFGESLDRLLQPSLIRTYRDLFVNVGFCVEREDTFHGMKSGVSIDVLLSVFTHT